MFWWFLVAQRGITCTVKATFLDWFRDSTVPHLENNRIFFLSWNFVLQYLNKGSSENRLTQYEGQGQFGIICEVVTRKNRADLLTHPCAAAEIAIHSLPYCYPETHNQKGIELVPLIVLVIQKKNTKIQNKLF